MRGTYKAKAKSWGLGESGTGKEQVAVSFDILTEGAELPNITWYGYFTEETMARTVESLRICGWKGDDLSVLDGLDANEVDLVIDEEVYEGKTQTKVKWINRSGGLALKAPLSDERKKAFAAAMRDRIRAIDAAGGKRTATAPKASRPPDPPPLTDQDIPF